MQLKLNAMLKTARHACRAPTCEPSVIEPNERCVRPVLTPWLHDACRKVSRCVLDAIAPLAFVVRQSCVDNVAGFGVDA